MTGIFGGGTAVGLEVRHRALRAASVKRGGGACRMEWVSGVKLPRGLLLDSFTEPNITDMAAFVGCLRDLFRPHRVRRVRVVLPDHVSRVFILDFDAVQGKKDEMERMIRWRLKKMVPFDADQAALRYQYLGRFSTHEKDHQHRFLVSIIMAEIVGQYEAAFREAGLRPDRIGISSFAVWNLYHELALKAAGDSVNFALMNLFGRKMTVMVFERGVLRFLRLKDFGKLDQVGDSEESMNQTRVLRELNASLTFYKENYTDTPVGKVFMAGDFDGLQEIAEAVTRNSTIAASVLELDQVVHPGGVSGRPQDFLTYTPAFGAAMER